MAESTFSPVSRSRSAAARLAALALWLALAALGALVAAGTVFFVAHAAQILAYPYPLDYGEGPLLAQVEALRGGTPIWALYANPDATPFFVVNYPPTYHLAAWLVSLLVGDALLAGRLVSLAATLGAAAALWALTGQGRTHAAELGSRRRSPGPLAPAAWPVIFRLVVVLSFLALPIVREWAVVMRVDMLGVCLGLWALVVVRRHVGGPGVLWAAPLLILSLFAKPSLLAAPLAAGLWLLFRDWRRALLLGGLTALGGGLLFAALQLASGGWFVLHILTANANEWQEPLARGFWQDQVAIHATLFWAAGLAALLCLVARRAAAHSGPLPAPTLTLALAYTCIGAIAAIGVGKVGAYLNYFLELYAGLIWLAALPAASNENEPTSTADPAFLGSPAVRRLAAVGVAALVAGALLRYYPLWSEEFLKPYGLIEGKNPPRLIAGSYGVWDDLARERVVLSSLGRINAAVSEQVEAVSGPIFTDVPGVAAQAGYAARVQAFEHRQLLDSGDWDQRALLVEMANGQLPLVVLDYLGNWLSPEMIAMITHRYAQDGSRGTYDLYRPLALGPLVSASASFGGGPRLSGYHLAPSPGRPAYHTDETVALALEWQIDPAAPAQPPAAALEVVVQLQDEFGSVLLEDVQPWVYGALSPSDLSPGQTVQHLQAVRLPAELLPMGYQLAVTLRESGRDLAEPYVLAELPIEKQAGATLGEAGYYVPAPLLAAWDENGAEDGLGDPVMPAVPFEGKILQCFRRGCLEQNQAGVSRLPLGELLLLGESVPPAEMPAVSAAFAPFYEASGGEAVLGPIVSGEITRAGMVMQYTRYARLERPADGSGEPRLGSVGEDYLRLPGGVPYRWPE